eukprot:Filipodium_phascolosomae@DN2301_c0_g1_i1.p2
MLRETKERIHHLKLSLSRVGYPVGILDDDGLLRGSISSYVPIMRWLLCDYSGPLLDFLSARGHKLYTNTSNSNQFVEVMFKILREDLRCLAASELTLSQFIWEGLVQKKLDLVEEALDVVKRKHSELSSIGNGPSLPRIIPVSPETQGF